MMRRMLLPFTSLYAAAIAAKNGAYDRGFAKAQALNWPVISVGNVSVGGSGKTPFVICMAKLLKKQGVHVDVLSRGYGRSSDAVERVDPAGNADRFGDEPLLIAQSANVPVYVGASRYAAGVLAEREQVGRGIHLLDDGFQHRKLGRALDLVVIHRTDVEETLLPAGRLREPLSSLQRATVLVLREEDANVELELRRRGIEKPIWGIRRSMVVPENLGSVVAFCGIARPDEFFQSLQMAEVNVVAQNPFRDHHRYGESDVRELLSMAQSKDATAFLTTEKDFVRLSPSQREMLASGASLKVAKLETVLRDEADVLRHLETLLPVSVARSL
jgi:tetraacyldisaccharide 4'-kinase